MKEIIADAIKDTPIAGKPDMAPYSPGKKTFGIPFIILSVLLGLFLFIGGFLAGTKFTPVDKTIVPEITGTPTIQPSPSPTPEVVPEAETVRPITPVKPSVTPPGVYGFTKQTDLPGIGIRASFPENTKISSANPSTGYTADTGSFWMTFTVYEYDGGSRRLWYEKTIGKGIYEAFSANNHQGYITYSKDGSGNLYNLGYFAAVRTTKMLVITAGFTDKEKLKSFLSTLTVIEPNPAGVIRTDQQIMETQRTSDTRKTVWKNDSLGLQVTAPEWIESRYTTGKNDDGTWKYSDWMRIYPEAKENSYTDNGDQYRHIYVTGLLFGGSTITILDPRYTGMTFTEVVNAILPGAGFCAREWKPTKSDCGDIHPEFCYTKAEVLAKLTLMKTAAFGPYTGQLRGINAAFSQEKDCRGEPVWLIQAKDKQYALSTIYPDSAVIKLEGF